MKRFYSFMLSAVVAVAASAAAPRVATEVVSPLPGGLNFQAALEKAEFASQVKAQTPAKINKRSALNLVKRTGNVASLKRIAKAPRKAEGEAEGSKYDGTYTMNIGDYYFDTSAGALVDIEVEVYVEDGEVEIYEPSEENFVTPIAADIDEESGVITFNNFYVGNNGTYGISFMPMKWSDEINDNELGEPFSITFDEDSQSFIFPDDTDYGFGWVAWEDDNDAQSFNVGTKAGFFNCFDVFSLEKNTEGGEDPEPGVDPEPGEEEETWTSLGMGEWYEGLMTIYNVVQTGLHWEVEIEECDQTPGVYRMKPYAVAGNPIAALTGTVDANTTIVVNATNPEKVYTVGDIEPFGLITFSGLNPENGFAAASKYGTLADKVISFPAYSFAYYEEEDGKWYSYSDKDFKIALPGAVVKDYSLAVSTEHACSGSTTSVGLTVGKDIAKLKMMVYNAKADASSGTNSQIVAANGVDVPVGNTVSFATPTARGHYSIMFAGLNSEDKVVAAATTYQIVDGENDEDWKVVPETTTKYTEGFLSGILKSSFDPEEFDVVLEENVKTSGRFRFESPYDSHSKVSNFTMADHSDAHKHYIYVNAVDPEAVFVEPSALGFSMQDLGAPYAYAHGTEFGKYENDVIEAPAFVSFNVEPNTGNYRGSIKLVMTKEKTSIKEISSVAADKVVYDIQGRRVANPTRGLYIINGKKAFVK